MKRRDFLASGMGALAAGYTGMGEIIVPGWPNATAGEMNDFLVRLDGAMTLIADDPGGGRFINALYTSPPRDDFSTLFRQSMRSLLLVGNFGDLTLSGQVHPGVQQRLRFSAPEMDASVLGILDKMKSMTPTDRADIKLALNEDPALADRVIEAIDLEAGSIGVPAKRRLQLRAIGKHVVRRLKQSSDMLVDEYVTKCEKMVARPASPEEVQRLMVARLGEAAYKARMQEAEKAARRWQDMDLKELPVGYNLIAPNDDERPWYRTGLWILGLGAGVTAIGWILLGIAGEDADGPTAGPGLVLGVTVGPIMLAVGLVTLLISGILHAADPPKRQPQTEETTDESVEDDTDDDQ